jgi:hypothetical protein
MEDLVVENGEFEEIGEEVEEVDGRVKVEIFGCNNCKYFGIANMNGDKEVCLATGEIILIEFLEGCPLKEEPLQKETTYEEITRYGSMVEEAVQILRKISDELTKINYAFKREDLEALIYGKTNLRKRDIRAVLDAIDKARKANEKHALRKFIATMGDVRYRDVVAVLDEIERLNERYRVDQ